VTKKYVAQMLEVTDDLRRALANFENPDEQLTNSLKDVPLL